jgi:alpha-tubulin suppressor-like RCC1 family protein
VISEIVAGSSQSFVIARKQAYGFGYNLYGQLGIISTTRLTVNPTPTKGMDGSLTGKSILLLATAVSGSHTIALATDGTLHAYGYNYYGQLGIATNLGFEFPNAPTNISTRGSLNGKTVSAIACGAQHTVILCSDGSLHGFGYNKYGQLGTTTNSGGESPNPTPINISSNGSLSGKTATKIACGNYHTIVLCSDGSLHSFGYNYDGQLGTTTNSGTYTSNPTPINITSNGTLSGKTITKIKCGGYYTFIICSDGSVHAFGQNNAGQLGSTTNNNSNTPNPTPFIPGGIASQLTGYTVSDIACGYTFTIVLATDGSLFSFGDNYYGSLGTSTNSGTSTPNPNGFNITSNGSLSGKTKSKIACGNYHTIVLCSDNTLHSFGYNYNGQLGTTTNNNTQTPVPTPTLFTVSE